MGLLNSKKIDSLLSRNSRSRRSTVMTVLPRLTPFMRTPLKEQQEPRIHSDDRVASTNTIDAHVAFGLMLRRLAKGSRDDESR